MRILFTNRKWISIKNDDKISKYSYGTRRNKSIQSILLVKWLLYDSNYFTEESIVNIIRDLKGYYDRHLAKIRFILQELTGVDRESVRILLLII